MRFWLVLLIFALLSFGVSASWVTYQSDLRNSGVGDGIGYFPLETANYSNDAEGMDFQPLIYDFDSDGKSEIVIFSEGFLKVFDYKLDLLDEEFVGTLLGQPTVFEDKIIFNSRNGNESRLFAYRYSDANLEEEFSIALANDADFGGIKCLNIDGTDFCVFKDKLNYVHVVDIDSRIDSFYNTSSYNERRQTVPAIGDIDDDGSYEAVFWLDKDDYGGYGFLAFDLSERKVEWIADDIFLPYTPGPNMYNTAFTLKGQPVLVDLNGDNKLEIASSVFYKDACTYTPCDDVFTEIIVYNSTGNKLFSQCEKNPSGSCNDGNSGMGGSKWEGTNPFVLDTDNDNVNEICFIKDEKEGWGFKNMAISCYAYNGSEVANVKVSDSDDQVKGTAVVADMNNDNIKEVITPRNVYTLDGTSIFHMPSLSAFSPIAADVDGNNGLDLVWTAQGMTKVFLDSNEYAKDLSIDSFDIYFYRYDEAHVNVSAVIRNKGKAQAENVKAVVYNMDTLENNTAVFSIRGGGNFQFDSILGLKEGEKVLVRVDYDDDIIESDEGNNIAEREFMGFPYLYISIGAEQTPQLALQEIKEYIKNNLVSGYFTEDKDNTDITVYIGKANSMNLYDRVYTMDKYGWGYSSFSTINYFDKQFDEPYAGIAGSYILDGEKYIAVYGNQIDGDIAAAKEFVKNQADFISNPETVFVIDNEDIGAIGIYDYLHQPSNEQYYGDDNLEFADAVKNALNDEMFTTELEAVAADGVQLRLKHIIPDRSSIYMDILEFTGVPVEMPVVLSRGVHSNLTTWEVLGGELANEGRDTWLIEITGGPGQDCDDCPNYEFSDLTDNYWPALINGILDFTGKDKIQYVGHSNGGRVAIVSLANNQIDPSKIDTLIGVAVPSAFEGYSDFGYYFGKYGGQIMEELEGKNHVSMTEIGNEMRKLCGVDITCRVLARGLLSDNKMSFNVDSQYYSWIIDDSDEHIGKDLQLDNFYLIQGYVHDDKEKNITHDFIVTKQDEKAIYNNIISSNKKHYKVWGAHTAGWSAASLPDRTITKSIIKDALNKKSLTKYESNEIYST